MSVETFEGKVRDDEYAAVIDRRKRLGRAAGPPRTEGKTTKPEALFGVALSGGGIRSASFCLGALQALDRFKLIKRIDYLSTVSGGGYVGGGMVSYLCSRRGEFPYSASSGDLDDFSDTEAVSHIRDHSRYLAPRGPGDLVLSAAVVLRGLMTNLVLVVSVLLFLATLILAANPTLADLRHSFVYDLARLDFARLFRDPLVAHPTWLSSLQGYPDDPFLLTRIGLGAIAIYLIAWALYRSSVEMGRFGRAPQFVSEPRSRWTRTGAALIVLVAIVAVAEAQGPIVAWLARVLASSSAGADSGTGFTSLSALGATAIAAIAFFREKLVGVIERALDHPTLGARFQAVLARLALLSAALLVPLLIYCLFLALVMWGLLDTSDPCRPATFAFAPDFLASDPPGVAKAALAVLGFGVPLWLISTLTSSTGRTTLKSLGLVLLKAVVKVWPAVLFALSLLFLYALITATRSADEGLGMLAAYSAAALLAAFVALNFTENANALHRLYRDRLNVAFRLGGGRKLTYTRPLHKLTPAGPYHLINCALNVRQSSKRDEQAPGTAAGASRGPDPAKRGRNAEPFIFSRLFVGSDATGYVSSERMAEAEPQVDFATAVAISGAAVSSSMGRTNVGLLGPTLAMLNLRLGFWLRNPKHFDDPNRMNGNWRDFLRPYLFQEAAGRLRSDSDRIYVTDGGHIDNIGLYQLLKRRCKAIIVVDAEADPAMNFGALIDVQRFARIDIGARIKLDWQPIRDAALERRKASPSGSSADDTFNERHFVFGTIVYDNGEEGLLLYIKASVTGDEPDYVLDYERRYPIFPHEATSNQFFSEEQMEAYRALGFHCVKAALDERDVHPLDIKKPSTSTSTARSAFKKLLGIEKLSIR